MFLLPPCRQREGGDAVVCQRRSEEAAARRGNHHVLLAVWYRRPENPPTAWAQPLPPVTSRTSPAASTLRIVTTFAPPHSWRTNACRRHTWVTDAITAMSRGPERYRTVTVTTAPGGTGRYNRASMEPWRTAIATSDATNIWIRGHAVTSLMQRARPSPTRSCCCTSAGCRRPGERRLLDAMLIGVADHGAGAPSCATARLAASGNRSVDLVGGRGRDPRDRRRARRRRRELHAADRRRARRWPRAKA